MFAKRSSTILLVVLLLMPAGRPTTRPRKAAVTGVRSPTRFRLTTFRPMTVLRFVVAYGSCNNSGKRDHW